QMAKKACPRNSLQKAMYEELMEQMVTEANATEAWRAVKRNGGSPGIDGMTTKQLREHIQAHWESIRKKLLAGKYVPSPVKRVEIPKANGGVRQLGIPTVQDRWIQQMLLQVLQPIFDPTFSEHSYGFRPKRSAQEAVRAGARIRAGRQGLGGGHGAHQIPRPRPPRHPHDSDWETDSGQAGVEIDWGIPARGSNDRGSGRAERRRNAPRRAPFTFAGQYLPARAGPGIGKARAGILPLCRG